MRSLMEHLRVLHDTKELIINDASTATLFDVIIKMTMDGYKNNDAITYLANVMCLITSCAHMPNVAYTTPVN